MPQDERPPKAWWDKCTDKARSFADDVDKYCGWLWHNGPADTRESIGKAGSDMRVFCGWGTLGTIDRSKELLPVEETIKQMETFFKRGAPLVYGHTNQIIGKFTSWKVEKNKKGHQGIYLCGKVFDDYMIDDKVWKAMKSGEISMLSIA